ncbi:MAG TPA: ABC transporter permease [Amnibacterium sp.]|jgi:ABC-2 type transport system permease protein|uniref:ABC transporter permease n=1 Tax=Amnibacterium sp. TaxID=1872496 RepID=UPI002F95D579
MTAVTARAEPGERRRQVLPFRVELARQLSQWRVRVVLIVLTVLPVIVRIALLLGGPPSSNGTDLAALAQASGATFAGFVLVLAGGFLVTLVAALLFGDLIAGEASRSTLKYLLTIPIPRMRLLGVKALVAAVILIAGIAAMTVVALLVGVLSYGAGGLQVPGGPRLDFGDSVGRLALTAAASVVGLLWAASLGTLLTVVSDSPLAAAGGVVLASILSRILDSIPALGDLRVVLPTHYSTAFRQFLTVPVDLAPVADSLLSGLLWSILFGTLAAWWFARKDISS